VDDPLCWYIPACGDALPAVGGPAVGDALWAGRLSAGRAASYRLVGGGPRWVEGIVSSLTVSLRQVLAVEGVRAAALIDIATGMVVRSAGDQDADFPQAAASMADEARVARAVLGPGRPGGDLDEISTVTAGRLHLSKVLGARPGEGLLLFVDLDRAKVNIALASLQVSRLAPAILA
jgi:hypothetical protein